MKAIIHIGMVKAGSSSIQTWLHSNRAALEAEGARSNEVGFRRHALRHAVFQVAMLELGADEKTAWVGVREKIEGRDEKIIENFKYLTGMLEKLSGDPGIFIYSIEGLFRCREIHMIALDKYLSRFFEDRTYVVYIRNAVDFFVSMYSQILRNVDREHSTREFSEFMKLCGREPVPYGIESSFEHLLVWDKMLGNMLNVRLLEPDWLVEGDLIEDFASLAGVPAFRKPGRMNESFAAEYVEYVRYLNREFGNGLPVNIRDRALEILTEASAGKPKLAASDAQAKPIRELHRPQEERIRTRFFPDRPYLFPPKLGRCGIEPVPLTDRRMARIESEIRKIMAPEVWDPRELARDSGR